MLTNYIKIEFSICQSTYLNKYYGKSPYRIRLLRKETFLRHSTKEGPNTQDRTGTTLVNQLYPTNKVSLQEFEVVAHWGQTAQPTTCRLGSSPLCLPAGFCCYLLLAVSSLGCGVRFLPFWLRISLQQGILPACQWMWTCSSPALRPSIVLDSALTLSLFFPPCSLLLASIKCLPKPSSSSFAPSLPHLPQGTRIN